MLGFQRVRSFRIKEKQVHITRQGHPKNHLKLTSLVFTGEKQMKRVLLAGIALTSLGSFAPTTTHGAEPCVVPRSWGRLVTAFATVSRSGPTGFQTLIFESEDGTIRSISAECNMPAKPDWEVARP